MKERGSIQNGIHLSSIDKAIVPDEILIEKNPYLEEQMLPSFHDYRRVRAWLVYLVEQGSNYRHTLLP